MKLLLDEHYSPLIAERLHKRGHDVIAMAAIGLAGSDDASLLVWAQNQERVLMTNNVQHFARLHEHWTATGRTHHGLWYTDDRRMPRSKKTIGMYGKIIDTKMTAHPKVDAFVDRTIWLP